MAWEFNRHVEEGIVRKLKEQRLWNEKLINDCRKGEVFLAIRDGYISFYYRGGSLFKFDGKVFTTHVKYASVIDTNDEKAPKDYVQESQLKHLPYIRDFITGYDGIKKNCALHSGLEAEGVSDLYHKNSYLHSASIFVLDIEIAFKKDEGRKQDRIDILLYDNDSQILRFFEAKHFSNGDLWSTSKPKVISQIENYQEQIARHKEKLIEKYGLYITGLNHIFNKQYKPPKDIESDVSLLIFGFDDAQNRSDRFRELVFDNPEYEKVKKYCKGDPKGLKAETIWNKAK